MGVKQYKHDKFYGLWAWSSVNFWSKVEQGMELDCWSWTGSNSPYGPLFGASKIKKDGKYKQQMTQARRILFAEHNGRSLGTRESVYHSCHNKHCMNPHHLSLEPKRRPQYECLKPGPKPQPKPIIDYIEKPKKIPKAKTKIHKDIQRLNILEIICEAN
jgi:hypothetical protein